MAASDKPIPMIQLPPWPAFYPAPEHERWEDFKRLARNNVNVHHAELNLLLARVQDAPTDLKGPDGTPLLTALLDGWDNIWYTHVGDYRNDRALAQLPLPGDVPWNREGDAVSWELPAALLIARGANPFEEGPEGLRPWDVAVQIGAAAVVAQMLRHPFCPQVDGMVDWAALALRHLENGKARHWSRLGSKPPAHPLEWALETRQEQLTRALAKAGAVGAWHDALFSVDTQSSIPANTPALITALVEGGARPLQTQEKGLVPLEVWAVAGTLAPTVRDAWATAVLDHAPEEDLPRAVAAALFANAGDIVPRLPGKPRGRAWAQPPFAAPQGLSWVEWAAVGVLARRGKSRAEAGASALQALPLKAEHLNEREQAWVELASCVTSTPLHDKFPKDADGTALKPEHVQDAWRTLTSLSLPTAGLVQAVSHALRQSPRGMALMETAARLLGACRGQPETGESLADPFLRAHSLQVFMDQVQDAQIPALMRAGARALALNTRTLDSTDFKIMPAMWDALFSRARSLGMGADVLDEDDRRALHEAGAQATGNRAVLFKVWDAWVLHCDLPKASPETRRKPRM